MNELEMATYVAEVIATTERFHPKTRSDVAERIARDAVLDLWSTRPHVTLYVAELAGRRVREALVALPPA